MGYHGISWHDLWCFGLVSKWGIRRIVISRRKWCENTGFSRGPQMVNPIVDLLRKKLGENEVWCQWTVNKIQIQTRIQGSRGEDSTMVFGWCLMVVQCSPSRWQRNLRDRDLLTALPPFCRKVPSASHNHTFFGRFLKPVDRSQHSISSSCLQWTFTSCFSTSN